MSRYLARNEEDTLFDSTIRSTVKKSKSKTNMAMFLQGQEQLNLLREIIINQKEMASDISALAFMLKKAPVLEEEIGTSLDKDDVASDIKSSLRRFESKLDDFIEYLCEETDSVDCSEIHQDAVSVVRLASLKAVEHYKHDPSPSRATLISIYDYILSCLTFCGNLNGITEENHG